MLTALSGFSFGRLLSVEPSKEKALSSSSGSFKFIASGAIKPVKKSTDGLDSESGVNHDVQITVDSGL